MRHAVVGCLLLVALTAPLRAMESAAALRLSDVRIASAAAYSRRCGGQALLVLQAGQTLHESYANGGSRDRPQRVMSITKNLTAITVFAAAADHLLDLDEPASKTITEWRTHPRKSRITIRQLLAQTSGLATGYESIYARGVRDKNRIAIALSSVAAPGERFDYGPGNYEVLEEILRRKLARRGLDPLTYLRAKVLAPLGIQPAEWRGDHAGNPFFSAGASLTARELSRIGEFLRARFRWNGIPIPPAAFIGSTANSMYGLSFWLNTNARHAGTATLSIEGTLGQDRSPAQWARSCLSTVAPTELIAMVGSGGQRCYFLPARKLVIVRFGPGANFSDAEFLRRLFGSG